MYPYITVYIEFNKSDELGDFFDRADLANKLRILSYYIENNYREKPRDLKELRIDYCASGQNT
jgi:hypothetical protein